MPDASTSTFSLTYRPKALETVYGESGEVLLTGVIGQPHVKSFLSNSLKRGRVFPGYLFAGHQGTGKTSIARILAKCLNCLAFDAPTSTPCGKCDICRAIDADRCLDVIEIDAASNGGIDQIRDIISKSSLSPVQGRYKIYVIDESHALSKDAQSAFLKTLEEPHPRLVFVLCTTSPDSLLPTIRSRCKQLQFYRIQQQQLVAFLRWVAEVEKITISDEALAEIVAIHSGGVRDSLQLLETIAMSEDDDTLITPDNIRRQVGDVTSSEVSRILHAIATRNVYQLILESRSLMGADPPKNPQRVISSLISIYGDLLILSVDPSQSTLLKGALPHAVLAPLASAWTFEGLQSSLNHLQQAELHLRKISNNIELWLEVTLLGLIRLCAADTSTNPIPTAVAPAPVVVPTPTLPPEPVASTACEPVAETRDEASQLWQSVYGDATEGGRQLLDHARLKVLEPSQVVVEVESEYFPKLQSAHGRLERLFHKYVPELQLVLQEAAA